MAREISLRGPLPHEAAANVSKLKGSVPRNLVIFIHGYNADLQRARSQYDRMQSLIHRISWRATRNILHLHWPGDHPTAVMSGLYFKRAARVADQCVAPLVQQLREWQQDLGEPRTLTLVAHSLGCRIAAALVRQLGQQSLPIELQMVLMGAAVPTQDDHAALRVAKSRIVLYSQVDGILRHIFPTGQRLIDGSWLQLPEAVGLYGNPLGAWSQSRHMVKHGHSDYWESQAVAQEICRGMRLTTDRPAVGRDLSTSATNNFPALSARKTNTRTMEQRRLEWRSIG